MLDGWRRSRADAELRAMAVTQVDALGAPAQTGASNGLVPSADGLVRNDDGLSRDADGLVRAAFFDLDKTLMAGSSGVFFARAAYESGMISRARLARDVYENLRFRLRGSTDDRDERVLGEIGGATCREGV
jgi:hypothetical protein